MKAADNFGGGGEKGGKGCPGGDCAREEKAAEPLLQPDRLRLQQKGWQAGVVSPPQGAPHLNMSVSCLGP